MENIMKRIVKVFEKPMEKAMDQVEANLLALESDNRELMNKGFTLKEMNEILKEE